MKDYKSKNEEEETVETPETEEETTEESPEMKKLKGIESEIKEKLEAIEKASESERKELTDKLYKSVKKDIDAKNEIIEKQQSHLDAMDVKLTKLQQGGANGNKPQSVGTYVKNLLADNEDYQAFVKGDNSKYMLDMSGKSLHLKADDMTSSNTFTSDVVQADRMDGIFFDPDRMQHVRQFLPVGTTDSDKIDFVQETALTDAAAVTGEGQSSGKSDFDLEAKVANVRKIATHLRLSDEMLSDLSFVSSYINQRFGRKIMLEEDNQLLYGSGTGVNIQGLTVAATAYSDALADSNVQQYDVLTGAIEQLEKDEFIPNWIMLHPGDWWDIIRLKDADNNYLFPADVRNGNNRLTIGGVPVIKTTAITEDDFLVGDFASAAMLFDRQTTSIEFSNSDTDNFTKGFVTVRLSERIALPIWRPSGLIFGDFATALAEGTL